MNIEEAADSAFADLLGPDVVAPGTGAAASAPCAWIAISDAPMVRDVAHELMRRGWRIGLATTHLDAVFQALGEVARGQRHPQLLVGGLRSVDGDAFRLIRGLAELPHPPALLLITRQQRAVLRAAESLARVLRLPAAEGCELPCETPRIADRAEAVVARARERQRPRAAPHPPLAGPRLRGLVEAGRIVPYLQPKARLGTREITGFEALMRAVDDDGTLVTPDRLIEPLAQLGLLAPATLQMAGHTLAFVADCLGEGVAVSASLNVSLSLMADTAFCTRLLQLVQDSGVDPSWITLEITETEAMSDLATVIEQTGRIRMYGFGLSIDDFGTAYSSFFQLSQIPFSELKLERSFVHGVEHDPVRRAIVRACAELGRALGLHVVAEGVETPAELEIVRALGCSEIQGYLLARPMPAAQARQWLRERMDASGTPMLAAA
ncbi:EAL domain-containing protein [Piscinibacter sakaiensis]|uniref:Diguanylate cyclase/phosphodiesterase with PAS/PAC sensor(S) n=1 Tax=Piscinibacter sakaiensis TaxID=1547922 RepID=A0A0K8P641_PISS1|nr:EAL domain-containing protein [Piscinibacter sakaiensis]GAP38072.1 diguanylate cyclase/phosphodiesterase with PAS/PAC sensor(s) [Piscinibacter sakaiensis]